MNLNSSLSYIFEDDDWAAKVGVGALLMLIPIVSFACVGYEARVIRGVARGERRPLSAWDDFGTLFLDGLKLGLARWIYSLPALALIGCSVVSVIPFLITARTEHQLNQLIPFIFLCCGGVFVFFMLYAALV